MKIVVTMEEVQQKLESLLVDKSLEDVSQDLIQKNPAYFYHDPYAGLTIDDFKSILGTIQSGVFCGLATPSEWFDNMLHIMHMMLPYEDFSEAEAELVRVWTAFLDSCYRSPGDGDKPISREELFVRSDEYTDIMARKMKSDG